MRKDCELSAGVLCPLKPKVMLCGNPLKSPHAKAFAREGYTTRHLPS